jgi:hypothetical protein
MDLVRNPHLTPDDLHHIFKHHASDFDSDDPKQTTSNVIAGIASHDNIGKETANQLLMNENMNRYVGPMRGMFKMGDSEMVRHYVKRHAEDIGSTSMHYFGKQFATIAEHKPDVVNDMSNIMLLHGHNDADDGTTAEHAIEKEMIVRDHPVFHKKLAVSMHKDILDHMINHGPEEFRNTAKMRLQQIEQGNV